MSEIKKKEILEILQDSNFTKEERKEFMELYEKSNLVNQCSCLQRKREKLLKKIHENENHISQIDYLRYLLEKNN